MLPALTTDSPDRADKAFKNDDAESSGGALSEITLAGALEVRGPRLA
jgi:hypothetical protein